MPTIYVVIDGVVVLSTEPANPSARTDISPITFTRSYRAPAKLSLLQNGWSPGTFNVEDQIDLYVDRVLVFRGVMFPARRYASAEGGEIATEWIAYDRSIIERTALQSPDGFTSFGIGTKVLADAVAELFTHVATQLSEMSINSTPFYSGGAGQVIALPTQFDNVSVLDAVNRLAAAAPGVEVFLDPVDGGFGNTIQRFHFTRPHGLTEDTVTIEDSIIGEVAIETSLEGRAGAVKTNSRQASGTAQFNTPPTILTGAWTFNPANWSLHDAYTFTDSGDERIESDVFRLYSFASVFVPSNAVIKCQVETRSGVWRDVSVVPESINLTTKTLKLVHPALKVFDPDNANRPNALLRGVALVARVRIKYAGSTSGVVTVPGTRHPPTGFAGPAFVIAPTLMAYVKEVEVPDGVDSAAYVLDAFEVYSRPINRGSVSFKASAIKAEYWNLQRKLSFASVVVNPTGYESLAAPMMGIDVEFGGGVTMRVDFSNARTLGGKRET